MKKRTILLGAFAAVLLAPVAAVHAHSDVSVSVSTPEFGIRIGAPVYRPAPVVIPAPVVVPAPVHAPLPVYAPAPAAWPVPMVVMPQIVQPGPVVVVPAYRGARHVWVPSGVRVAPGPRGYRHWEGRHERREHRRHRHDHRAGYDF